MMTEYNIKGFLSPILFKVQHNMSLLYSRPSKCGGIEIPKVKENQEGIDILMNFLENGYMSEHDLKKCNWVLIKR